MEYDSLNATPEAVAAARCSPDRLSAVRDSGLLDSAPDQMLDRLTRLAAGTLSAPCAFISMVDQSRDFYKSEVGFPEDLRAAREMKGLTFCHYTLLSTAPLVIQDTLRTGEFAALPTVRSLGVRAYIGAPILSPGGENIGSFCVMDTSPREWSTANIELVESFAAMVSEQVALRSMSRELDKALLAARASILERERVLASVVHDLRSPLNTISLSTHVAMQGGQLPERLSKSIERIDKACSTMADMLSQVLHSNLQSIDGRRFDPVPVGLGELITDAMSLLQPIAEKNGITLIADGPETDTAVLADYGQLIRVFSNLVGNAVKFSPVGSRIVITSEVGERAARIAIQDEGCGIDAADVPFIFVERWKKDADGTRGVGLGLSIAKAIVERYGGSLNLAASDIGCRFEFTVPRARPIRV